MKSFFEAGCDFRASISVLVSPVHFVPLLWVDKEPATVQTAPVFLLYFKIQILVHKELLSTSIHFRSI